MFREETIKAVAATVEVECKALRAAISKATEAASLREDAAVLLVVEVVEVHRMHRELHAAITLVSLHNTANSRPAQQS